MPFWKRRPRPLPQPLAGVLDEIERADAFAGAVQRTTIDEQLVAASPEAANHIAKLDRQADDLAAILPCTWTARVNGHEYAIRRATILVERRPRSIQFLTVDGNAVVAEGLPIDGRYSSRQEQQQAFDAFAADASDLVDAFMHEAKERMHPEYRLPALRAFRHLGRHPELPDEAPEFLTRYGIVRADVAKELRFVRLADDLAQLLRPVARTAEVLGVSSKSLDDLSDVSRLPASEIGVQRAHAALKALDQELALPEPMTKEALRESLSSTDFLTVDESISRLRTMSGLVAENEALTVQAFYALTESLRDTMEESFTSTRVNGRNYRLLAATHDCTVAVGRRDIHPPYEGEGFNKELLNFLQDGPDVFDHLAIKASGVEAGRTVNRQIGSARDDGARQLKRSIDPGSFGLG